MSRNLTYDRSWGTIVCLEGDVMERVNAIADNHALGEIFERLPSIATRDVPESIRDKIDEMQYELRRTRFETPDDMDGLKF